LSEDMTIQKRGYAMIKKYTNKNDQYWDLAQAQSIATMIFNFV